MKLFDIIDMLIGIASITSGIYVSTHFSLVAGMMASFAGGLIVGQTLHKITTS